tara:strand:- start:386 stop:583 length:198 start_codon:yes stop_codon:yes gene_type:complete
MGFFPIPYHYYMNVPHFYASNNLDESKKNNFFKWRCIVFNIIINTNFIVRVEDEKMQSSRVLITK